MRFFYLDEDRMIAVILRLSKVQYGTTNDIGIIWPPQGSPIIVSIYFTQNKKDASPRDDVIASVTRIMINSLKVA